MLTILKIATLAWYLTTPPEPPPPPVELPLNGKTIYLLETGWIKATSPAREKQSGPVTFTFTVEETK